MRLPATRAFRGVCTGVAGTPSIASASVLSLRATPGDEVLVAVGGKVACWVVVPVEDQTTMLAAVGPRPRESVALAFLHDEHFLELGNQRSATTR